MPRSLALASLGSALVLFVFACSSSKEEQAVGVNDVLKACSITSAWTQGATQRCGDCRIAATTAKCACSDLEYAGKCSDPQAAITADTGCAGIDDCVRACDRTDCACIDRCSAGKSCRPNVSARDGCVAQICDAYCR